MLNTLIALGTKIDPGNTLLISFIRSKLDDNNELRDQATMDAIKQPIDSFITGIK